MESRLNFDNGYLNPISLNDSVFIQSLFLDKDIKSYYIVRDDIARNMKAFVPYLVVCNEKKQGINYVIYNSIGQKVGFITAELVRIQSINDVAWNIGYAVAPQYRGQGYATGALNVLSEYLFRSFSILTLSLDICMSNKVSQHVAEKCGYEIPAEPGKRIGYIDPEHVEMGMRLKWFRIKSDKRAILFKRAIESACVKDFHSTISYYKAALDEVCQKGSPFTDAQIYSNLGMSYSSLGQYNEAFRCLKKAQALGLNNPSIERELLWLKNNVGLF